jgi:hypothetical protein
MLNLVSRGHYERDVDDWIVRAISGGAQTFGSLVRRLPSVYPTVVLTALRRLADQSRISPLLAEGMAREVVLPPTASVCRMGVRLPLPHPLNYEWRFSDQAAKDLLRLAKRLNRPGDKILLFGTPRIASTAIAEGFGGPMLFLGENNPVTAAIRAANTAEGGRMTVVTCDTHELTPGEAGVVVLDPPWYMDFIRPMLAAAAAACRFGGHVVVSLPPNGVRPSARDDRTKILYWAHRQGLSLLIEDAAQLSYETPFFEANALAAAGVTNVPADWRRGDLVIFRKFSRREVVPSTSSVRKNRWKEVFIGSMRLFIRTDRVIDSTAEPAFRPVAADEIMPTVSRRDPRRHRASLWTSGDRAFVCDRRDLVMRAAMSCADPEMGAGALRCNRSSIDERHAIEHLGITLRLIAEREEIEARSVGTNGGVAWGVTWKSISMLSSDRWTATLSG